MRHRLVEAPREELAEGLRHKPLWSELTAMVQVAPNRDLFLVEPNIQTLRRPTLASMN
jgi:hypothetical protein